MGALNFKEIPAAHNANGLQDTWESFALEVLKLLGYSIEQEPFRGTDRGADLIVIGPSLDGEMTAGPETKWLVSCKHKAHSGASVTQRDEQSIVDRVFSLGCDGFIGFYSSVISTGIAGTLKGLFENRGILYQILSPSKIEAALLGSEEGRGLAKRYFPISFQAWEHIQPRPFKESLRDIKRAAQDASEFWALDAELSGNNTIISLHPKVPDAHLHEPVNFSFRVHLGDTSESTELESDIQRALEGQGSFKVDSPQFEMLEVPELLLKTLIDSPEDIKSLEITAFQREIPVRLEMENDNGDIEYLGPICLVNTAPFSSEEFELSNSHASDAVAVTLKSNLNAKTMSIGISFDPSGQDVDKAFDGVRFMTAFSKGGFFSVELLELSKRMFRERAVPSVNQDSKEDLQELVKTLRLIQTRLGKHLKIPVEPVYDIGPYKIIAEVLRTGRYILPSKGEFSGEWDRSRVLSTFPNGDFTVIVPFKHTFPASVQSIKGLEGLDLGPCTVICERTRVPEGDIVRLQSELDSGKETITIRLEAFPDEEVVLTYYNWLPPEI